jgi:hypothetical protein
MTMRVVPILMLGAVSASSVGVSVAPFDRAGWDIT